MSGKNAKATSAMKIAEGYARIVRLRQDVEVEFRKIEAQVKAEGVTGIDSEQVKDLRLAHSEALHRDIINGQATWHNIAFDRGYFDVDAKPRKLSKSDQYK
jgi:hypothetical protein